MLGRAEIWTSEGLPFVPRRVGSLVGATGAQHPEPRGWTRANFCEELRVSLSFGAAPECPLVRPRTWKADWRHHVCSALGDSNLHSRPFIWSNGRCGN